MKKHSSFHLSLRRAAVYVLAALVIIESSILLLGTSVDNVLAPVAGSKDDMISWKTVTIGGVVTFEIPKDCEIDAGAGSSYLICPTEKDSEPTPEMHFSSDGTTVNVRRWEDLETPYWNHIIGSMKIIQPMERDITVNVEK